MLCCTIQLRKDGGDGRDLLDVLTRSASPGQLSPMAPGDYRLTVRLVRAVSDNDLIAEAGASQEGSPYRVFAEVGLLFHVREGGDDSTSVLAEDAYLRQEGFRQIWVEKHWGVAGMGSGTGSTVEASRRDRALLASMIVQLGVRRLYDAGCGSSHWQPILLHDLREQHNWTLAYHGADIVPEVIERNRQELLRAGQRREGGAAWQQEGSPLPITFSVSDMARDDVPLSFGPDMILCRHALFHNTNAAIRAIIERFNASSTAKFLAATTLKYYTPDAGDTASAADDDLSSIADAPESHIEALNRDGVGTDGRLISLGGYRPVDLQAPPFSLPPPFAFQADGTGNIRAHGGIYVHGLGIWRLPLPPWQSRGDEVSGRVDVVE